MVNGKKNQMIYRQMIKEKENIQIVILDCKIRP